MMEETGDRPDFEAAMAQLERIVSALEGEELDLDQALHLFESGVQHLRTASRLLNEVRGRIEEGLGRCALLEACFPGGSITGAPKVRAMQIIDELEAGRRGPYTGSIGWLGDNGALDLNIAIRTAVLGKGVVRVHVGGGIVADSQPEAEYAETLAKGEAMFRALSSPGV